MTHFDRKNLVDTGKSSGLKSPCTSAVLRSLGIYGSDYRYSQTIVDTVRIIRRKGYYCHSRKSQYKGTLKQIKSKGLKEIGVYLIWIMGHVMLIDYNGNDLVDTDSSFTKGKRIKGIWLIHKGRI